MERKDAIRKTKLYGRISGFSRDERTGLLLPHFTKPNQIQAGWGHIAARQIGFRRPAGRLDYSIGAMYFEFENVVNPEDAVTVPDYGEDEGLDYYWELQSSSNRDFLRIPLAVEPTLGIEADHDLFTPGVDGNKLTFFAQTSGVTGNNGKEFSDVVNSKVFGVALVATPFPNDWTQDEVFARTYFAVEDQVVKTPNQQVALLWDIIFN